MAHARYFRVYFVSRQLTAFAGLRALGDFYLHHLRIGQVFGGHSKTPRCNLLNGGTHGIAVDQRFKPRGLLAALTGIGFAANAIHGNRQGGVRLTRY